MIQRILFQLKPTGKTSFLVLFFIMAVSLAACTKDSASLLINEDDIADVVTNTLSSKTGGLITEIGNLATYLDEQGFYTATPKNACDTTYDSSFTASYTDTLFAYDYNKNWFDSFACARPDTFVLQPTLQGNYQSPTMSSTEDATGNWLISGLDSTVLTLNGTYQRNGNNVSKVRNKNSFVTNGAYTFNSLHIDKSTHEVTGTCSVIVTSVGPGGRFFNFEGIVTFAGNGTATFVSNDISYPIVL